MPIRLLSRDAEQTVGHLSLEVMHKVKAGHIILEIIISVQIVGKAMRSEEITRESYSWRSERSKNRTTGQAKIKRRP
jgi:hypothetical protein